MKQKEPQQLLDRESLKNLTPEQLVEMVLKLQELVVKQGETIEKLKGNLDKDSKTSSKPPSTDLLRKPEKAQEGEKKEGRSPGGQKGHEGKTRKGFGRIDRTESIKAEKCPHCGSIHLAPGERRQRTLIVAQQKCLAHLLRHFKQVEKLKTPHQTELAQVFLDLITEAFRQHRQYRETGARSIYNHWVTDFRLRLEQALAVWRPQTGYAAGLLLKSLLDKSHQWWYFLEHTEVSPDNNRAERSLRLGVTKRKMAGGSRFFSGFVDTARLLTVIQSCRAQGRSVLTFFRQALASVHHPLNTVVSLIPTADFSLFVNP